MTTAHDDELREQLAIMLTGGVHYYELTDSFMNDGAMTPEFPKWASDVAKDVDDLVEIVKARELAARINLHREIAQNRHRLSYQNELYKNDLEELQQLKSQQQENEGGVVTMIVKTDDEVPTHIVRTDYPDGHVNWSKVTPTKENDRV